MNINSLFNKTNEIHQVLNLYYDLITITILITLNESKFDDTVPNSRFKHIIYNKIRLDRNGNGSDILIFIKNCYLILEQRCYTKFEIVTFKLKIRNQYFIYLIFTKSF